MTCHFSLTGFKIFLFSFQQFYCDVSICESLHLYTALGLLSSLDVLIKVLNQIWEVFSHHFLKYIFSSLFLIPPVMWILLIQGHKCENQDSEILVAKTSLESALPLYSLVK